ncbi:MAG: hypothetical protein QM638_05115 [Nocardioides sp.]|uniref:hypothetical protein n=1 Tax=Nocardioides sp. TaxID=35761 RepID=UPI0039E222EF
MKGTDALHAVDHVIEQLWQPALTASSDLRVVIDPAPDPAWRTVESYWLIPRAESARLLVPTEPRAATRRALTNYRRLRTRRTNLARAALGAAATAGLPLSRSRVAVQARAAAPADVVMQLPISLLSTQLGFDVVASTGVRTSDNRKTMLHLVDRSGTPAGYAKVGWNPPSDELVATEGEALAELGGRTGPMRAPALLARIDYHGHPITVTAPLPFDVRGSSDEPTAQELFGLLPVVRHAPIAHSAQLAATMDRLRIAAGVDHVAELGERALTLALRVSEYPRSVPITSWWHGDLAPWNTARDGSGQLWVWDWENAERDAVAGLDALHWTFSSLRLTATDLERLSLTEALARAAMYLTACGLDPTDQAMVAAHYGVVTVERACTLACHAGTWAESLISPAGLARLLDQVEALLGWPHDHGSIPITTR